MALRSVGSGADQIATGANGGRLDTDTIPQKGHLRYNTKNGHFEGYSPKDLRWRLLDYVPEPETLNDVVWDINKNVTDGLIICNNFTIENGVSISIGTQNLVIYAFGDALIKGGAVINGQGKGGLGASDARSDVINNSGGLGQGGAGGFTASNGYAAVLNLTGSGGGRSGGEGAAGRGGAGGGGFAIKALGNITNKGRIVCTGTNGANGSGKVGGAGGGSGGVVILDAGGDCINEGTIDVKGGNAGSGSSGNGGGGGGGGIVILQAVGKTKQQGSVIKNGGGGSYTSGSGYRGAAGGSCGGKGGTERQPGATGIFARFGSPFSI